MITIRKTQMIIPETKSFFCLVINLVIFSAPIYLALSVYKKLIIAISGCLKNQDTYYLL